MLHAPVEVRTWLRADGACRTKSKLFSSRIVGGLLCARFLAAAFVSTDVLCRLLREKGMQKKTSRRNVLCRLLGENEMHNKPSRRKKGDDARAMRNLFKRTRPIVTSLAPDRYESDTLTIPCLECVT